MKFTAKKAKEWLLTKGYSDSYLRKILGLSQKQGAAVAAGDLTGFEVLTCWLMNNEPRAIVEELELIETKTGLSRAHCALLLGIPQKLYTRARNGEAVESHIANYVRLVSSDPVSLDLISKGKLWGDSWSI